MAQDSRDANEGSAGKRLLHSQHGPVVKFPTTSSPVHSKLGRLQLGPVVDKFFLTAYLAGLIGIAYLGIHLWMILNGLIPARASYLFMRQAHAEIQIFLFLGLFILGFMFQASPKLFGVPRTTSRWCLTVPALLLLGVALRLWPIIDGADYVLLTAAMAAAAVFLSPVVGGPGMCLSDPLRGLAAISLVGAVVSPWIDIGEPVGALLVFWWAWGGFLFIGCQQFISGMLEGRKLAGRPGQFVAGLYLVSCIALAVAAWGPVRWGIAGTVFGALSLVVLLSFLWAAGAVGGLKKNWRSILGITFLLSFAWALAGSLMLLRGAVYVDLALHAWALGWATTLLVPISLRILSFLGEEPQPDARLVVSLVLLWQLVPLGRTLGHMLTPQMAWVVGIAASIVYIFWGAALLPRISKILRRQFSASTSR